MHDTLPTDLVEDFLDRFARVVETGEPEILSYKLTVNGVERRVEGVIQDTTANQSTETTEKIQDLKERERLLHDLHQSEELFAKVFRVSPLPMSLLTAAELRYLDVNDSFLEMSGYTRDEVIGHISDELGVCETPELSAAFKEELRKQRSLVNLETNFRTKNGSFRVLLSSAELVEVAGDECLLVVSTDITERKQSELALQHAHEELRQLKIQLEEENLYLQQELQLDHAFNEIVGHSDAIKYVLAKISQVAPTDSTVLIQGETGTGKELVARAIHNASAQRDRPLIKVNCAALSATLIESELFGHEKGAFTGAAARKLGRFELADRGTIFLDEVGELPLDLQVKLLRVVQEGEFERVGGSRTIKVNVRLIAATNRDLKNEVDHGRFREDLWYRLNVFPITVPPLRQRREDLPLLVEHFVSRSAKRLGKTITSISGRAMQSLEQHSWPGNVRELANVIERAVIGAQGPVLDVVEHFELVKADSTPTMSLHEMEREYITRTLESTGWRVEGPYGAAKILGLNASTLRARMHKLGIQRHGPRAVKPQNFTRPLSNTDSAKY
jgi:PAS domain S-box-containing protein